MTPQPTARNAVQRSLLRVYALVRATGLLETSLGRRAFEWAYDLYKRWDEAAGAEALQPLVAPGTLVIDVGANIGFFTVRFARWVSVGGRVLAIEPETTNLARLRRALSARNLQSQVEIIAAAATDRAGPVHLDVNPDHPGDHRLAATGQPVAGVTVDQLVAERGWSPVSLMKIDVQGAEAAVIAGAREVLTRLRPALYVEIDDLNLRSFGSSAAELCATLSRLGYTPYRCQSGAATPYDGRELLSDAKSGYVDVLFLCGR